MSSKNYKSFDFNDLKKCMQWFGYSAGELIEIIEFIRTKKFLEIPGSLENLLKKPVIGYSPQAH